MPLSDELDDMRSTAREYLPEELSETLQAAIADLAASGLADSALGVGDTAPSFSLPGATGTTVSLAERLTAGPVALTFYRGGWCPYCNLELNALQAELPAITDAGASLLAVSPQTPDASLTTAEKAGLDFDVLSDVGNVVARQFGLVFRLPESLRPLYAPDSLDLPSYNGDDDYELPIPATYVIDHGGTIRWAFVDADHTRRAEPADIVAAIRTLS